MAWPAPIELVGAHAALRPLARALVDALVAAARRHGRDPADLSCEVLSTMPRPLGAVLARHGLGRWRVLQKANLADVHDVYRSEQAVRADWVMLGTHDTASIFAVIDGWADERRARWAEHLAHRLALPPGAAVCGACLREPPPFGRAVAAVDYVAPWDDLVRRFKFDAALDLGDALAQRVLDAVRRSAAQRPDWLLPVPLAAERLRERGYNQAWELTRRVARELACASDPWLLLRMRDTPHQLSLPPAERAANVRGAFAIDPLRRSALQGRSVALLDDVMTTGATLSEAARAVLHGGAASVQVWVLARTPRPEGA